MAWVFGDIDFSEFGVMVSKSTGVLDFPKLKHEGTNWLDADGLEYWQDDTKYNDREIVLNCWIYAEALKHFSGEILVSGYANFKTKVEAFTEAIKAAGKVNFETPFITIPNCSISTGVTFVRETNYVNDLQIGTFTLRITVHGDPDFDYLTIYDKSSGEVKEVVKTKNLTIQKSMQGEEYATCTVETNTPLLSGMYEFIKIITDGSNYDYFLLTTLPAIREDSTNKLIYDLRFDGITVHLKQMNLIYDGRGEFEFYGNLQDVADLICTNVNRFVWFNDRFSVGSCAATQKKLHVFSNEDCLSALQRMCAEYNMEFKLKRVLNANYEIIISDFIGETSDLTLEYGKGNTLYQITRGAMDTSKLCTVLWAFGAAKNLKSTYRGGKKRLSFDANPLRMNEDIYGTWEHIENFDEIFPNRSSVVTGYLQVLPENLTAAEKEVYPDGIFVVGDSTLDFDLNQYLLGGLTAKIAMKSGNLAGYQFDILRYDNILKLIHIIRFKDEAGGLLPNATLQIAPGDEYTLIDVDQPTTYVTQSESDLQAAGQAYIEKWSVPQFPYSVKTNPAFSVQFPNKGFNVGDVMNITDINLGINLQDRITSLTYSHRTKTYDLNLATFKRLPQRQQTEFRLQTIERAILLTKKDSGESIKEDVQNSNELRRILLDPTLDKLKVDNIISNNSLDARMIGLDAKTSPVELTDAWFEANVGGNVEAAKQYAGFITIKNFEGINRFEVKKMKDNNEVYDPSRTWAIPETNFTGVDATKSYNIYARLDLTPNSTDSEVFLDERHIDPKEEIQDLKLIVPMGNLTIDDEV